MTPDKLQRIEELSNELASLLYEEANPEELLTLKDIENSVRNLSLQYVLPNFGVFFIKNITNTTAGRTRRIKSCLGNLTLTEAQAEKLQVENHSRISPLLQQCCLIVSANESYAHAAEDVAILTGMKVPKSTQQRLVHQVDFPETKIEQPVTELSVDGGKVRLITPTGEPSAWRDYKAVNLHGEAVYATFQAQEELVSWINKQSLATPIICLGDGHAGIWKITEQIAGTKIEILDWYHLKENLYKIKDCEEKVTKTESHLWQGDVDKAIAELRQEEGAKNFVAYLENHRNRIVNYKYYQEEGISIGSGAIESSIKQIGRRVKISGAQWKEENVPQVLRHRTAYLNGKLSGQH